MVIVSAGRFVAAAVALTLVSAACRGDEPPAGVIQERISKVEFVREGNAICARGNEAIASVARQPEAGADRDAAATFVRVFAPGIRDQIRQMRALGYPKGDEATLEAIFADAEALLQHAEADPTTIDGHAFDDVNARLTAYGLYVCGS